MIAKGTCLFAVLITIVSSVFCEEWEGYNTQNFVTCTARESAYLWIGSYGGVVRLNTVNGEKNYYDKTNSLLPDTAITCLAIDSHGNKWIGTMQGLCRFDGDNWTVWNISNSGIPGNSIRDIAIDMYNSVWVATNAGLGRMSNNSWTVWNTANSELPINSLRCLEIDASGNKWIGTSQGAILYSAGTWSQLSTDDITCMDLGVGTDVWFGTGNHGLVKYNGSGWTYYNPSNSDIPDVTVECLDVDSIGNVWLSTEEGESSVRGGLIKFDGTTWTVWNRSNSDIPMEIILHIYSDTGSSVLLGTAFLGLTTFTGSNWITNSVSDCGLLYPETNCIAIDSYNRKWFGTMLGISLWDNDSWTSWGVLTTSDPIYNVTHVVSDNNNNIWINANHKLMSYNGATWTTHQPSEFGLQVLDVTSLDFDAHNNLWIGISDGLIKLNNESYTVFNATNSPVSSDPTKVVKGLYNDYWVSTLENGLLLFNGTSWASFTTSNSSIPSNQVLDIALDSNGNKWLATANGLCKFDDATWAVWNSINSALHYNKVSSLAIDSNDKIWLTSNFINQYNEPEYGELSSFDGNNWTSWSHINSPLSMASINEVIIDSQSNKWISTSNGVLLFNEDNIVAIADNLIPDFSQGVSITNFPNPFNPSTTINYTISKAGETRVCVFNTKGQLVKTLVNESIDSGNHQIIWNGLDNRGNRLASGVYLVRIEHNGQSSACKVLMLK